MPVCERVVLFVSTWWVALQLTLLSRHIAFKSPSFPPHIETTHKTGHLNICAHTIEAAH